MNLNNYINKPIRILASNLNACDIGLFTVVVEYERYSLNETMEDIYLRRKIIKNITSNGNCSYTIYTK